MVEHSSGIEKTLITNCAKSSLDMSFELTRPFRHSLHHLKTARQTFILIHIFQTKMNFTKTNSICLFGRIHVTTVRSSIFFSTFIGHSVKCFRWDYFRHTTLCTRKTAEPCLFQQQRCEETYFHLGNFYIN